MSTSRCSCSSRRATASQVSSRCSPMGFTPGQEAETRRSWWSAANPTSGGRLVPRVIKVALAMKITPFAGHPTPCIAAGRLSARSPSLRSP